MRVLDSEGEGGMGRLKAHSAECSCRQISPGCEEYKGFEETRFGTCNQLLRYGTCRWMVLDGVDAQHCWQPQGQGRSRKNCPLFGASNGLWEAGTIRHSLERDSSWP